MNQEDAFLRAICENPDDDTPRLVYADWLEEHGDTARAEFIRVQIELERKEADDPATAPLRTRAEDLLRGRRDTWRQELPAWARLGARFRRGFVAEWCGTAAPFLRGAAGLFRKAPVQRLALWGLGDDSLTRLAELPQLGRVVDLNLQLNGCSPMGVRTLCASRFLGGLAHLTLQMAHPRSAPIGPAVARVLAKSSALNRLAELSLESLHIGPAGVRSLGTATSLGGLTALRLRNNGLVPRALADLADSPLLSQLQELDLGANQLGVAGVRHLTRSARPTRLNRLDLCHAFLGNSGAAVLAEWPGLASVEELLLGNNDIGPDGVRALAASPHLGRLRRLELRSNPIGDEGARALADAKSLGSLTWLQAYNCEITRAGSEALAASPGLRCLASVVLGHWDIKAADLAALQEPFRRRIAAQAPR
jgi:uncharacterized protein (TIGR02996 family)